MNKCRHVVDKTYKLYCLLLMIETENAQFIHITWIQLQRFGRIYEYDRMFTTGSEKGTKA